MRGAFIVFSLKAIAFAVIACISVGLFGCASVNTLSEPQPISITVGDSSCSGTAIGSHTILTATHCLDASKTIVINKMDVSILNRVDDGYDHTILTVEATFKGHATFAGMPSTGSRVHIIGNPGFLKHVYSEGTVAGLDSKGYTLLNVPIFYGDSGSAVRDSKNRIVGVITAIEWMSDGKVTIAWSVVIPFEFSSKQIKALGIIGLSATPCVDHVDGASCPSKPSLHKEIQ